MNRCKIEAQQPSSSEAMHLPAEPSEKKNKDVFHASTDVALRRNCHAATPAPDEYRYQLPCYTFATARLTSID